MKKAILQAILILLLLGTGCRDSAQNKCIFVLFDISGSTLKMREQFYQDFQEILEKTKGGDRIIVDCITENPLAQSKFQIKEKIPVYGLLKHYKQTPEKEVKEIKGTISTTAKKVIFERRKIPKTKILDAIQLARRVFNTYPEPQKILVLFSDMIEESERYNFISLNLTKQKNTQIIEKERTNERIPDLHNVKVYVIGATAVHEGGMLTEKIESIREFWLLYFKECGADLTPERYGSCLLEFEN